MALIIPWLRLTRLDRVERNALGPATVAEGLKTISAIQFLDTVPSGKWRSLQRYTPIFVNPRHLVLTACSPS